MSYNVIMNSILVINTLILISMLIVLITLPFIAIISAKKNKLRIINELKRIKESYIINNKEIVVSAKGIKFRILFYSLVVLLEFDLYFLLKTSHFDNLYRTIGNFLLLVSIDVIIVTIIYYIFNKKVKSIQVKENTLFIKHGKSTKEYNIKEIEEIKYRISHYRNGSSFYLYIKNKQDNIYDGYCLEYYKYVKLIALISFIKYIMQNKIEKIDNITEDEIVNIEEELITKRLNDEEVKHIVL